MFYDDGFDKEVEKALQDYLQKFKENFPLMEFEGNKQKLIKTIKKSIKNNKKFYIDYDQDEDD